MIDPVESLLADLLEWIAPEPRGYDEVLDAWRTSCPRLPVWEEANERGFVATRRDPDRGVLVGVTEAGRSWLTRYRSGAELPPIVLDREPGLL